LPKHTVKLPSLDSFKKTLGNIDCKTLTLLFFSFLNDPSRESSYAYEGGGLSRKKKEEEETDSQNQPHPESCRVQKKILVYYAPRIERLDDTVARTFFFLGMGEGEGEGIILFFHH